MQANAVLWKHFSVAYGFEQLYKANSVIKSGLAGFLPTVFKWATAIATVVIYQEC